MITSVHIENFKCFKDFKIDLGPFNVLIGPNDSGKTAFLEGVHLVGFLGQSPGANWPPYKIAETTGIRLGREAVWRSEAPSSLSIKAYATAADPALPPSGAFTVTYSQWPVAPQPGDMFHGSVEDGTGKKLALEQAEPWFARCIGTTRYYDFQPEALREPSVLTQDMSPTGGGFAGFVDNINRDIPDVFAVVQQAFQSRFPHYGRPRPKVIGSSPGTKKLVMSFPTVHGHELSAESVSDGVMLSLVYLAVCLQPHPPRVLLIEEPENGVHHASLKDIVETLKQLSTEKGVQVILTTHSPYLLDCVEPEEVRVFTKDKEGAVHAKRLSEYEDVAQMKKDFMTGEIWTILAESQGI